MIVNEIAKLENPPHARFRSCLYPISARSFSSASCVAAASVAKALSSCREPLPV